MFSISVFSRTRFGSGTDVGSQKLRILPLCVPRVLADMMGRLGESMHVRAAKLILDKC